MTFYNDIFKRSWEVTRKNRVLWLFGFFVLMWGGKSVDIEVFFTNGDLLSSATGPFQPEFWQFDAWQQIVQQSFPGTMSLIGVGLVLGILLLLVLALMVVSQIGLVDAFIERSHRAKKAKYTLGQVWDEARTHGLPVFGINLLGRFVSYGLLAVASTPLFLDGFSQSGVVYSAFLFLVLTPFSILVSVLMKYAITDRVAHGNGVIVSYANAWLVFIRNIGTTIEMALMMFVAYVAAGLAAILSALLLTMPLFIFGMIAYWNYGTTVGVGLFYVFLYLVAALTLTVTVSLFSTWHYGNWTILYQRLTKGRQRSKIHRTWKK